MKIPRLLSDWNLPLLEALLEKGIYEDDSFDFKEMLPDSRNQKEIEKLRKTCAAFANSDGGFLVYGVSDSKTIPAKQRIVGMPFALDFPAQFGSYPQLCSPSIYWEFLNAPLRLDNEKVVHVVHIPKSWRAPHVVELGDGKMIFPKRTNKGNEHLSTDEIRSSFLGFYEKRLKLQLLYSELSEISQTAQDACVSVSDFDAKFSWASFDTAILDSIIADTYSITAGHQEFHKALSAIRRDTRVANNKIHMLIGAVSVRPHGDPSLNPVRRTHNEYMETTGRKIQDQCKVATEELKKILGE